MHLNVNAKEWNVFSFREKKQKGGGGGMVELVDATDLIQLSLGRKTYQMLTFRLRET